MPHIHDCNLEIYGCKVFSKLDLVKAYNQIPVNEQDIHKTAIATPIGLYEWRRMPFGLCTAAQTFQRFIDEILQEIPGTYAYQDDVIIFSKNIEEHYKTLNTVLKTFDEYGVIVNRDKCELCKEKITALGYEIDESGIKPSPEKLEVINNFELPNTEADLHNFVGLANYYNRFIPACSLILAPLYKLFTEKKKCKKLVKWTDDEKRAFEEAKKQLNNVCLTHPDPAKEISIMTDASDIGLGGVVQQLEEDSWRPIQFFARKLTSAETRYSTFGRELLAAFECVKRFKHHVEGRDFTLFTDHKPLVPIIGDSSKTNIGADKCDREKRQLDYLIGIVPQNGVKYIPGKENIVADALSRAVNNIIFPMEVELLEIHKAQDKDESIAKMRQENFITRKIDTPNGQIQLLYNNEQGYDRLYIPLEKRKDVFLKFHGLAHNGQKASKRFLMSKYFWPGMSYDIARWVKECNSCSLAKSTRKTVSPLGSFPTELDRFHTVHIDLITMNKEIEGSKNVLTMIDRKTCWAEAVHIKDTSARTVAWQFINTWVRNYGVPKVIVTDQGKQFESQMFNELCKLLGTTRSRTTPYHPQANAKVERFHKTLKEHLLARSKEDWYSALPIVLLTLRNTYREDLKASPAQLVYGRNVVLPNELVDRAENASDLPDKFVEELDKILDGKKSKSTKPHGNRKTYVPKELMSCEYVYEKAGQFANKETKYTGPYEVKRRTEKVFDIVKKGKIVSVSIDNLKPCITPQSKDQKKSVEIVKQQTSKKPDAKSRAQKKTEPAKRQPVDSTKKSQRRPGRPRKKH